PPIDKRKFSIGVNSASRLCDKAVYEPVRLPNRLLVSLSSSRSPTSPISVPMAKTNRCSVSISSAWTTIGPNAKTAALVRIENKKKTKLMLDKNDRGFIYPSPSCTEGDELTVKSHHKHPALAENTPCAVMFRVEK